MRKKSKHHLLSSEGYEKKLYEKPQTTIIPLETEGLMAGSATISSQAYSSETMDEEATTTTTSRTIAPW